MAECNVDANITTQMIFLYFKCICTKMRWRSSSLLGNDYIFLFIVKKFSELLQRMFSFTIPFRYKLLLTTITCEKCIPYNTIVTKQFRNEIFHHLADSNYQT